MRVFGHLALRRPEIALSRRILEIMQRGWRIHLRHPRAREIGPQLWTSVQDHYLYFNWPLGHYPILPHADTMRFMRVLVLYGPKLSDRPGAKSKHL
jgi:hypothetical protein